MIIVDTNIISTFCRVDKLPLLYKLFPKNELGIPAAVYDEMMEAIRLGYSFLNRAKLYVENGDLHLFSLTSEELQLKQNLPYSFGACDLECIIISQRSSHVLLTNDKRMRNYCRSENITVYNITSKVFVFLAKNINCDNLVFRQEV